MQTIRQTRQRLEAGEVSARNLIEEHLERIADPDGEGSRAFLHVADDEARQQASSYDAIRAVGGSLPPFAGIAIAVKDLFDIAGQVTTAGSIVLSDSEPAAIDAPAIARLRSAGFIIIGRTNMTEFAYSGLGLNSHYQTPSSPWRRADQARIAGGSSSGSAVAVAERMAVAGLGTDTGGSCRIPAAFCGIVGYKPTARRVPLDGVVPLATSLDSVGPLAPTVDCASILDQILSGATGVADQTARPAEQIRLAALTDYVLDDLDPEVATQYESSLTKLTRAGIQVVDTAFPELCDLPEINRKGGLVVAEAFAWHHKMLSESGDRYDQRVRVRIEPGAEMTAVDYIELVHRRTQMIEKAAHYSAGFDAFVLPTVAALPPTIDSFEKEDAKYYSSMNLHCLRNTAVGNFLDSCSISIPATNRHEPPVGLMLMGPPLGDTELFQVARTVESALAKRL